MPAHSGNGHRESELDDPAFLRELILAIRPDLEDATFRLLLGGWDCVAVDVGDRLVFKVPRDLDAAGRLRTEAAILEVVRPAVSIPVPDLQLVEMPRLISYHDKLPGDLLLSPAYASLPETAKARLAEDLAQFLAELHRLPVAAMQEAGAPALDPWLPPDDIIRRIWSMLPQSWRGMAEATIAAWSDLAEDPNGKIFGHFDLHGWNIAFDPVGARLNGVFDFGDSRIGALHEEFIAPSPISPDLTARILPAYEQRTELGLDHESVSLLTGAYRLCELAVEASNLENVPVLLGIVAEWFETGPGILPRPA